MFWIFTNLLITSHLIKIIMGFYQEDSTNAKIKEK